MKDETLFWVLVAAVVGIVVYSSSNPTDTPAPPVGPPQGPPNPIPGPGQPGFIGPPTGPNDPSSYIGPGGLDYTGSGRDPFNDLSNLEF